MATKNLVCFALFAVTSTSLLADEARKQKRVRPAAPGITRLLVGRIELTDAQKAELKKVDSKFADRFKALVKKQQTVLTDEQKKAQRTAITKAREEKKTAIETRKDIASAVQLTDKQKALQKELGKAREALNKEVVALLKDILTEEQFEELPRARRPRAEGKPSGDAG